MNYFLIGIKGSGMSALAKLLYDKNNYVVGSDVDTTFFTEIEMREIRVLPLGTLLDGYTYIIGNAFVGCADHIEAIKRGYEMYRYNEFIDSLDGIKIAISGTHGKTTTTALTSYVFADNKIDYIIGDGNGHGRINNDYLIFEACEYRNTFLGYHPDYLVINNIEYEHTDFFTSINEVIESFSQLAKQSGYVLINGDCENCRKIEGENVKSFGFSEENDFIIKMVNDQFPYKVKIKFNDMVHYFEINFYGKHMIYNASAAIILGLINHVENIQENINNFIFPKRRMEEYILNGLIVVDDYAHHPTEIKATIEAIKEKYQKEIILVFQPHTYSRTLDLEDDYIRELSGVKELYIADVFSSIREVKIKEESRLIQAIKHSKYYDGVDSIPIDYNKVLVFMGAGDIYKEIEKISECLNNSY